MNNTMTVYIFSQSPRLVNKRNYTLPLIIIIFYYLLLFIFIIFIAVIKFREGMIVVKVNYRFHKKFDESSQQQQVQSGKKKNHSVLIF